MARKYPVDPRIAQKGSMLFKRVKRSLIEIWVKRKAMIPTVMRMERRSRFKNQTSFQMFKDWFR
jgi:hypothetical protein